MKTVTGKITDSTPVSISKAASILSKFVSSENGASQALNAYLRRATAAFDELSRLHSKSERRKHKKDSSLVRSVEASQSELVNNSEQMLKKEVKEEGSVGDEEIESKKERKRKSKRKRKGDLAEHTEKSNGIKKEKAEVEENGSVVDKIEIREEEEKKKRKRKGGEVEVKEEREEEEKDGLEEEGQRKRRRRKQVDDN